VVWRRDEAFAFDRTVSRLIEMQSEEYRQTPHTSTRQAAVAAAASEGQEEAEAVVEMGEAADEEPFLLRFESQLLSDADIRSIWAEYDADSSGSLDRQEVERMVGRPFPPRTRQLRHGRLL
jgi:hypothetical protein